MISISLVEDDDQLRTNISDYLKSTGEFVCLSGYSNGEEALNKLPFDGPQIVLMDIDLKLMSGIECVHKLKPLMPESLFIMLTAFGETDKIFEALSAGACGYLLKQHPPAKLIEALKEALGGGSPMSPLIARKVVASFQDIPPLEAQTAGSIEDACHLSPREIEVLEGLARGLSYEHIASQIKVSIHTIRTYIRRIYDKLHVKTRTQAVAKYYNSKGT